MNQINTHIYKQGGLTSGMQGMTLAPTHSAAGAAGSSSSTAYLPQQGLMSQHSQPIMSSQPMMMGQQSVPMTGGMMGQPTMPSLQQQPIGPTTASTIIPADKIQQLQQQQAVRAEGGVGGVSRTM